MNVLGRTNRVWPDEWWRLAGISNREDVALQLRSDPRPVLAAGSPSLWADALRGSGCGWLVVSSAGAESARTEDEAANRMMGEICAAVSSSPDAEVTVWFLTVARAWEEFQINGALSGLESARQEGLVRHVGLHVAGPAVGVAGLWRFHDAFELVLCKPGPDFDQVVRTARERRVGVVQDGGEPIGSGPLLREVSGG